MAELKLSREKKISYKWKSLNCLRKKDSIEVVLKEDIGEQRSLLNKSKREGRHTCREVKEIVKRDI